MEKVLITGVAGFIGANFAIKLLKSDKEIQVIGIDNLNDYYDVDLKKYRLDMIATTSFLLRQIYLIQRRFLVYLINTNLIM